MTYFPNGGPRSPSLPRYSNSSSSAVQEKLKLHNVSWFAWPMHLALPNVRRVHPTILRFGWKKGMVILLFFVLVLFTLEKRFGTRVKNWPHPFLGDPSTLIFEHEDLRRIWQWEIASGHYPSQRSIPRQLGFPAPPHNPAIPIRSNTIPLESNTFSTEGTGRDRTYLDIKSQPRNVAYPPRPIPGSVADLDVIMDHCDFSQDKYVRDCLEVLRVGAGLDTGNKLRRINREDWRYVYMEHRSASNSIPAMEPSITAFRSFNVNAIPGNDMKSETQKKLPIALPPPIQYRPFTSLSTPCDPDNPRIFHMFWTGPFTDKPYTALLSFLFTQNTGLHLKVPPDATVCRPQFWMWINPGPAASVPNPSALHDMYTELKTNPWASPFLHPRFKSIIRFKLWNTTEQLDGIPELKNEWRNRDLFNSNGRVILVPQGSESQNKDEPDAQGTTTKKADADNILNRTGSKSLSTYDRLSVILSDMARFILCHRFGGTYLDADTIFLRDWEELWGWKGAFAYRWSRLKRYNTAVLHMNKGSALGTFLFQTALKNDLDFHPKTIARYTKDAHLEGLLLRLPDALFDSAWLNTEYYQRDRPPQPYFKDFADFFETPDINSAAPQALGFDGFFKGAYSYHFHNFWWKPFDSARNWPDLGSRFAAGERMARAAVSSNDTTTLDLQDVVDKRDLDWATVLKRTFEAYIRGERPNMYGEWLEW